MSRERWAAVVWAVFALTVGAVVCDWGTRMAGYEFVLDQQMRAARGLPLDTIDHGFRPLVAAAGQRASLWMLLVLGIGAGSLALITRTR
jgi:hypothetical protein